MDLRMAKRSPPPEHPRDAGPRWPRLPLLPRRLPQHGLEPCEQPALQGRQLLGTGPPPEGRRLGADAPRCCAVRSRAVVRLPPLFPPTVGARPQETHRKKPNPDIQGLLLVSGLETIGFSL